MFQHQIDRGGSESPKWVIVSDLGNATYLHDVQRRDGRDVPIWCCNLDKAKRFKTLGDVAEVLAILPSVLEAYEEDPRMIQWMESHEYPETPDDCN